MYSKFEQSSLSCSWETLTKNYLGKTDKKQIKGRVLEISVNRPVKQHFVQMYSKLKILAY